MAATVGQGRYKYEVLEDWAQVPQGWAAPMAAVTVDSHDRVYGFNRGDHGVIVFDMDGRRLFDWGETDFAFPHTIYADRHDNIWIVDRNAGQVLKYTTEGELLLSIGKRGYRSDTGRRQLGLQLKRLLPGDPRGGAVQPPRGRGGG